MTALALAGSGWIAAVHGMAAAAVPGVKVTRVASRSRSNAERRARELGASPCDYDELPAGADVVVVCTPPALHARNTLAALGAGAAVIVEKPLCTTLADADRVVAAAEKGGHRVGYAENLAFAPIVLAALARAPALGPLRHVEVRALQGRPTWGDFLTREWGGGVLFDLGVHPVAIALLLAREAPVSVRATLDGAPDIATDEHAEVDIEFASGLRARVVSSWRSAAPAWDLQAAGDSGVVRAELLPAPSLESDGEPVELPPPGSTAAVPQLEQYGYLDQLRSFTEGFRAGQRPRMDAAFGRGVLDLVCAAYASAGSGGAPEPLPFTGPRDRTPLELWRP